MRNSCCNRSARGFAAWIAVISIMSFAAAGHAESIEKMSIQTEGSTSTQSGKPALQVLPHTPAKEISPEIAALYQKYGAYCDAIVDEVREQRYALKRAEIEKLASELEKRIEVAEAQSAALEKWVSRREEFAKQATAKIVEIYANMRPEASASRLQQLDINLAASLLLAIPPRQASPILNEMDEKFAAAITGVMAASARVVDPS